MSEFRESRESARYPVSAVAQMQVDADGLSARVSDVGRRGLFAEASARIAVGTPIHLTLVVDQPVARLEIDGVVVRVADQVGGHPAGLGVEITDPSAVWDRFYEFLNSATPRRTVRDTQPGDAG